MGYDIAMKIKRPTSVPIAAPSTSTYPMRTNHVKKVRTSICIDPTVLFQAKREARTLGVSFNAYLTLALSTMDLRRLSQTQAPAPAPMSASAQALAPIPVAAPAPAPVPALTPEGVALQEWEKFYDRWGDGFTFPAGDTPEEPECYVTWDMARQFFEAQHREPDKDFWAVGKRIGLEFEEVRAAEFITNQPQFGEFQRAYDALTQRVGPDPTGPRPRFPPSEGPGRKKRRRANAPRYTGKMGLGRG